MRKALLLLVAFSSIGFAQETSNDTVKHWTRKGVFTLLANQSSFSNWQAGGQNNFAGNVGMNYDFNYKCPDNIPFPYNPNGEKCCCVDLNWVGGSGPGNIQIPTSCVCYGTVTRP